jgi:hypothetical protein
MRFLFSNSSYQIVESYVLEAQWSEFFEPISAHIIIEAH